MGMRTVEFTFEIFRNEIHFWIWLRLGFIFDILQVEELDDLIYQNVELKEECGEVYENIQKL